MTLVEPDRPTRTPSFVDGLAEHGAAVAVVTAERTLTYAELDEAVAALAGELGGARRLVLVEAANTIEALVALLGALRGGHPVILAAAGGAGAGHPLMAAYDPDVVLRADRGWAVEERRATAASELHPDLALLLSTSGSTGSPKLVRLSRESLETNAAAIVRSLGITGSDRAATTLPLQYCYGLSVVTSHLAAGAGLVLTDSSVVDERFWELFRETGVTSLAGVPHTFDLLDRVGFPGMSLPRLRRVTQAGGRLLPDTVRRYAELGASRGWDLFVMYGQTEATARMAYLPPALAMSHPHTIGLPIPGGRFALDDPDDDGVGELVYSGPNVMLGYADRPADLALGRAVDVLATGDLGRRTPEGLYEVVGRRSRFIKPCGLRVDLDRVEALLADRGIVGASTGDDHRLVVAVERREDVTRAARVVSDQVGLPGTHVQVVLVDEIPRLGNGKTDHAEIRRRARERPTGADEAPACAGDGDVAAAVGAGFVAVLGVEPAGGVAFVDLGGDSLSYVEMSVRLEQVLGPLPRDWHRRTIDDLVSRSAPPSTLARVDTTVVLRAVAIVLVVGSHTSLWGITGGAHTLLAIAGMNLARFRPDPAAMVASVARIAVPSMCWIGVVAAVGDEWRWPNALLVNGWLGSSGDPWGYWYIEAIVQIVVPLAALLAVPAVRRLDARAPFGVAVAAVVAGLVIRFDVLVDVDTAWTMSRPHEVFWIFAVGWAAGRATTSRRRLLVSVLALAGMPGFFGGASQEVVVLAGIVLAVWVPAVPLPRAAGRVAGWLAGASLYTYLTHYQVYPPLLRLHGPLAAVVGSLLIGIAVWLVARRAVPAGERALRGVVGRRRAPAVRRAPRPPAPAPRAAR